MSYEGYRKLAGLRDAPLFEADLPVVSKYDENPEAYNAQIAKLMQQLKRDKNAGVTGVRMGYKGTGKQAHKRQIWVKMPSHERGGPDVWLEGGFVKVGGIIDIPKSIPSVKKYEGETPEAVYKWIADTMQKLKAWQDEKYAQSPAVAKEETEMNVVEKLDALRQELESKIANPEPGPAKYEPLKADEPKSNEPKVGKAMPWPTKGGQSKPKPVSLPVNKRATVEDKLEALRIELEALGEAHTPTAYRIGTVRTWKSGKFKKTATGWVPVTALLKKVAGAPKGATKHQDLKHAAFGKTTHDVKTFINTPGVVTYVPPGTGRKSPEATRHATPSGGSTPGYSHQVKPSGSASATKTPGQSAAPGSKPGGVMRAGKSEHTSYSTDYSRLMGWSDQRVLPEAAVANMSDEDVVKTARALANKAHKGKLAPKESKDFKMAMQRIKDEGLLGDDDQKDIWQWSGKGGQ